MSRVCHDSNGTGPIAANQFSDDEDAGDHDGKQELLHGLPLFFLLLREALLEVNRSLDGHRSAKLVKLFTKSSLLFFSLFLFNHCLERELLYSNYFKI